MRNYHPGVKWLPGVILKKTEPVSFIVRMEDGHERRCHQDQVRSRSVNLTIEQPVETETPVPRASVTEQDHPPVPNQEIAPEFDAGAPDQPIPRSPVQRTYPVRTRTAVQRYEPSW